MFFCEDVSSPVWLVKTNGGCIFVLGLVLLILNERHGMHLLNKAKISLPAYFTILFVYSMGWFVIANELVISHSR